MQEVLYFLRSHLCKDGFKRFGLEAISLDASARSPSACCFCPALKCFGVFVKTWQSLPLSLLCRQIQSDRRSCCTQNDHPPPCPDRGQTLSPTQSLKLASILVCRLCACVCVCVTFTIFHLCGLITAAMCQWCANVCVAEYKGGPLARSRRQMLRQY